MVAAQCELTEGQGLRSNLETYLMHTHKLSSGRVLDYPNPYLVYVTNNPCLVVSCHSIGN
jgi:hypothetical protein